MKKLTLSLIMISSPLWAQSLDEILASNLEARGGLDAWQKVNTVTMTGAMRMVGGQAGELEIPFLVEFKRPGKVRLEFTMQGMTAVQAYDGTTGWAIMPFLGKTEPEEIADDQLKELVDRADFEGLLINYKEKGHQVTLLDNEEVDGTPAFKLKVTKENGDETMLYLDQEYFVEFKTDATRSVQGNEMAVSTVLGDYKDVQGLLFPHSMEASFGGGTAQQVVTIQKIELGVDIADDRFTMPPKPVQEEQKTE